MKFIKVKKEILLRKLTENRKSHKDLVEKAKMAYKEIVKRALEELLQNVEKDKKVDFNTLYHLSQPMDKTDEYDRAIEMLNMSIDDVIEISDIDFRCFVQDEWDWKDQAFLSNTRYLR